MQDLQKSVETKSKSKLSYYNNKRNSGKNDALTTNLVGTPEVKRISRMIEEERRIYTGKSHNKTTHNGGPYIISSNNSSQHKQKLKQSKRKQSIKDNNHNNES